MEASPNFLSWLPPAPLWIVTWGCSWGSQVLQDVDCRKAQMDTCSWWCWGGLCRGHAQRCHSAPYKAPSAPHKWGARSGACSCLDLAIGPAHAEPQGRVIPTTLLQPVAFAGLGLPGRNGVISSNTGKVEAALAGQPTSSCSACGVRGAALEHPRDVPLSVWLAGGDSSISWVWV